MAWGMGRMMPWWAHVLRWRAGQVCGIGGCGRRKSADVGGVVGSGGDGWGRRAGRHGRRGWGGWMGRLGLGRSADQGRGVVGGAGVDGGERLRRRWGRGRRRRAGRARGAWGRQGAGCVGASVLLAWVEELLGGGRRSVGVRVVAGRREVWAGGARVGPVGGRLGWHLGRAAQRRGRGRVGNEAVGFTPALVCAGVATCGAAGGCCRAGTRACVGVERRGRHVSSLVGSVADGRRACGS